jgi:hypothetical protein
LISFQVDSEPQQSTGDLFGVLGDKCFAVVDNPPAVEIHDVLLQGMDVADPPHSLHDQRALIAAPLRPLHRSIADKSTYRRPWTVHC